MSSIGWGRRQIPSHWKSHSWGLSCWFIDFYWKSNRDMNRIKILLIKNLAQAWSKGRYEISGLFIFLIVPVTGSGNINTNLTSLIPRGLRALLSLTVIDTHIWSIDRLVLSRSFLHRLTPLLSNTSEFDLLVVLLWVFWSLSRSNSSWNAYDAWS